MEHRRVGDGRYDIDLEGHRRFDDNNDGGTVAPDVLGYRLITDAPAGVCSDIVGLFHERPEPWPPGPPVTLLGCRPGLTGRHVTDYDGFYCAIGEAIDGPGGYFGGDAFWLHENAIGDGGATHGFRLIWHDSAVARAHLVPGHDRKSWAPAVTFDDLVERLTDDGVRLELR